MRKAFGIGTLALLCAALAVGTAAFAGGGEECGAKSADAKHAKHECNMTAEECAQEMQKGMATRGWLGIVMDHDPSGEITINKIYERSPAEQAGFEVGDRIVSINGVEVGEKNHDKIYGNWKKSKIGDEVTYVVARDSENVTLKATLAKMPETVLAESLDKHMKEDHTYVKK